MKGTAIKPASAAAEAIKLYDRDGDGKLSEDELIAVPGILKWKTLYDLDSDGYVSRDEIAQRLNKWQTEKVGFRSIGASVKLGGRPVPNVEIVLIPESYLSDSAKPAQGITNQYGFATLAVAPEDLPAAIKSRGIAVGGVYPGTYKISLSHPQRKLPEVSSSGIPLGEEIASDTVATAIEIVLPNR